MGSSFLVLIWSALFGFKVALLLGSFIWYLHLPDKWTGRQQIKVLERRWLFLLLLWPGCFLSSGIEYTPLSQELHCRSKNAAKVPQHRLPKWCIYSNTNNSAVYRFRQRLAVLGITLFIVLYSISSVYPSSDGKCAKCILFLQLMRV